MGVMFSVVNSVRNCLLRNNSGLPLQDQPICYLRTDDYSICGTLRSGLQDKWDQAVNSMIFLELDTRRTLWPIIRKRMDRMEASLKYTNCNLDDIRANFPKWEDRNFFELHDLFQAFEVDGDGLIEIAEMSVGLDNLGDTTLRSDRIPQLTYVDKDNTGSIDFEEFLQVLYDQQQTGNTTSLAITFAKVNNDIKFIRWMSTVQQIRGGYL